MSVQATATIHTELVDNLGQSELALSIKPAEKFIITPVKNHQPGPLFDPFETLSLSLIREKNHWTHMHTDPDESEVRTPDDFDSLLFDFYPSPVDLPIIRKDTVKAYSIMREKMKKRLAVANANREIERRKLGMAGNENGWDFTENTDDEGDNGISKPIDPNDPNASKDIPAEVWVPSRALEAINMEKALEPEISDTALAQKILKENLPLVAVGITHTAKYASDARLRFQAQTYVMDRVLGKVGTSVVNDDSPLDELNKQLMELVNAAVAEDSE